MTKSRLAFAGLALAAVAVAIFAMAPAHSDGLALFAGAPLALTMPQLEDALRGFGLPALFRAEAPTMIERYQARLEDLQAQMAAIEDAAVAEDRDLTEDENAEIDKLFKEFEGVRAKLATAQSRAEAVAATTAGQGRRTAPPAPNDRVEPQPTDPKMGFRSVGEFAHAVALGSKKNAMPDKRLVFQNAPTTAAEEGVGEDGGFLVPPDFAAEIEQKVEQESSIASLCATAETGRNAVTRLQDETTPWDTTNGIQVYWDSELDQLSQSKPQFKFRTQRLNRITALVPVSEELLEDAPMIGSYIRQRMPEKMAFSRDLKVIRGTGAGEPLGILNANALVTVDAESGQTADTVVRQNIENMWTRMYAACRRRAVWLVNQDVEPQLSSLAFDPTGGASPWPLFIPGGSLANAPNGSLKGRPIVPHEAMSVLGDAGDIVLADLTKYELLNKVGGPRIDQSMHLWFDYVAMAFRMVFRVTGEPVWQSTISRRDANNTNTLSCFVALAARA